MQLSHHEPQCFPQSSVFLYFTAYIRVPPVPRTPAVALNPVHSWVRGVLLFHFLSHPGFWYCFASRLLVQGMAAPVTLRISLRHAPMGVPSLLARPWALPPPLPDRSILHVANEVELRLFRVPVLYVVMFSPSLTAIYETPGASPRQGDVGAVVCLSSKALRA